MTDRSINEYHIRVHISSIRPELDARIEIAYINYITDKNTFTSRMLKYGNIKNSYMSLSK